MTADSLNHCLENGGHYIVVDCYYGNNPMREGDSTVLFWDWAIVTVGSFSFPTPIHTASKTESFLFTASNREVMLSHRECACVTAYFYLSHIFHLERDWSAIETKLDIFDGTVLQLAFEQLKEHSQTSRTEILFALRSQLSDAGNSVLD